MSIMERSASSVLNLVPCRLRYDPSRGGRIVSHVETWQLSAYEVSTS